GDRHQGDDDVTFLDVILDPFPIDRDIPLDEVELRVVEDSAQPVGAEVHTVHTPIRPIEYTLGQMMPDKAIDAQYQYLHFKMAPSRFLKNSKISRPLILPFT